MRIAIINMPCRASAEPNIVPLGIYYVGQALRKHLPTQELNIVYCDLNLLRPATDALVKHELSGIDGCDIYMMSGLITTLDYQKLVAAEIRKRNPKAKIITGGGLATNICGELKSWIDVDTVVVGEGEHVVGSILRDIATGSLSGFYAGSVVQDLDAWDMVWPDVLGLERYINAPIWGKAAGNSSFCNTSQTRSLNMITSRGCPMECKFCSREATGGRRYRMRSPDSVINEVRFLVDTYALDFIGFVDDNMCVDRDRMRLICDGLAPLAENGLRWGCHARFDMHYELVEYMAMSGCRHIGFGAESASEKILKAMKKRNAPKRMAGIIDRCRAVGIHPNCTWIMGWPGETLWDLRETIQFIITHAPENRNLFVATAYPGTELWLEVRDKVYEKFRGIKNYVSALGDATLPLMNYSAMSDQEFYHSHRRIQEGRLESLL